MTSRVVGPLERGVRLSGADPTVQVQWCDIPGLLLPVIRVRDVCVNACLFWTSLIIHPPFA